MPGDDPLRYAPRFFNPRVGCCWFWQEVVIYNSVFQAQRLTVGIAAGDNVRVGHNPLGTPHCGPTTCRGTLLASRHTTRPKPEICRGEIHQTQDQTVIRQRAGQSCTRQSGFLALQATRLDSRLARDRF